MTEALNAEVTCLVNSMCHLCTNETCKKHITCTNAWCVLALRHCMADLGGIEDCRQVGVDHRLPLLRLHAHDQGVACDASIVD